MVKNKHSKPPKWANCCYKIFDFRGYLGAENTHKSRSLKAQYNVLTLAKQVQNTNGKVQKMKFSTRKMSKNEPLKCQK